MARCCVCWPCSMFDRRIARGRNKRSRVPARERCCGCRNGGNENQAFITVVNTPLFFTLGLTELGQETEAMLEWLGCVAQGKGRSGRLNCMFPPSAHLRILLSIPQFPEPPNPKDSFGERATPAIIRGLIGGYHETIQRQHEGGSCCNNCYHETIRHFTYSMWLHKELIIGL